MTRIWRFIAVALLATGMAVAVAACGGGDDESAPAAEATTAETTAGDTSAPETGETSAPAAEGEEIVIGTSLTLTGALGQFGAPLQMGYEKAINEVNDAGGIDIGGVKHKVRLEILDNKSDPNLASEQARELFLEKGAVAQLGSSTPPIVIPISQVADQVGRPMVSTNCPIRAWLTGTQEGWTYAWDVFFDELQMTDVQFQTTDLIDTNKKVALFTDTEEDGVVMGGLWTEKAPDFGYEIVSHATFPVGTTDFEQFIEEARDADAEVLIAQMVPPDAVALWKQMKAVGYQPKAAFCEKCGNSIAWPQALGDVAEGTMAVNWWSPELGLPRTQEFLDEFEDQIGGVSSDLSIVVGAYSVARLLLDAIDRADSLEPDPINEQIAATDYDSPFGHITFAEDHTYGVPVIGAQWRGTNMDLVWPAEQAATEIVTPVPGLG
jgi:branched-chain amino acid transport system substrate-binding protein